jgi:hypothetical protein
MGDKRDEACGRDAAFSSRSLSDNRGRKTPRREHGRGTVVQLRERL